MSPRRTAPHGPARGGRRHGGTWRDRPDKRVAVIHGDAVFGFNGFEYDTMVRLGLPVVGVVGNDGVWNTIKTFQRFRFPDRDVAPDLGRRPYHDVVSGLGGHAEAVADPAALAGALEQADASPALVNVHRAETVRMSSNYGQ